MEAEIPSPNEEKAWQNFLISNADRIPQLRRYARQLRKYNKSAADNEVLPPEIAQLLKKVTEDFQRAEGIGRDQTTTLKKTTEIASIRYGFGEMFQMGPDRDDLREQRPYFMVPLDKREEDKAQVRKRILDYVAKRAEQDVVRTLRRQDVKDDAAWGTLIELLIAALPTDTGEQKTASPGAPGNDLRMKLARYLVGLFKPETLQRLREAGVPGAFWRRSRTRLENALLAEINDALIYGRLYGEVPASGATVSEEDPEGAEHLRANRAALVKVFPDIFEPAWEYGPITDIFVLSHGWHRNFFGAAGAYDRIACRIALLMHRERFAPLRREPPFHPLFLMVHWHSDPGANGWVDRAGRRSKVAFLDNCERLFERPTAHEERDEVSERRFTSVLESIYALFTQLSAPDTRALEDPDLADKSRTLADALNRFELRDAPGAEQPDKVVAAWAAYHAAPALRFLANQGEEPGRFVTPQRAFLDLLGFLGKVVTPVALAGLLLPRLQRHPLVQTFLKRIAELWQETTVPIVALLRPISDRLHLPDWVGNFLAAVFGGYAWMLVLAIPAFLWLAMATLRSSAERRKDGVNLSRLVAFVILLLPCALPLVGFLLLTYITGSLWPRFVYQVRKLAGDNNRKHKLLVRSLFDERIGKRNADIEPNDAEKLIRTTRCRDGEMYRQVVANWFRFPRYHLARLARWPVRLLRGGLAPENPGHPLIDAVDNQFAFWEMQVMGTDAGRQAALFVSTLYQELQTTGLLVPEPGKDVRVHLLGHSFGGLLVSNLARHLALDTQCRRPGEPTKPIIPKLQSICLLEAAMASTWFEQEDKLREYVRGGIGCIFSGYDSANGFYYPLANNGRLAAGFSGLYLGYPREGTNAPIRLPARNDLGRQGMFAALVLPPVLRNQVSPAVPEATSVIFNLDASRLIFDGPIAAGGGHSDIYKDDVMHLCWAITRL